MQLHALSDAHIDFVQNDGKIDRLGQESISIAGQLYWVFSIPLSHEPTMMANPNTITTQE